MARKKGRSLPFLPDRVLSAKRMNQVNREQINHPQHYGGDTVYEVIKVIEAWGLGFHDGNAVKYIARAGKKDPAKTIDDLKKARWYLDRQIARLESSMTMGRVTPATKILRG